MGPAALSSISIERRHSRISRVERDILRDVGRGWTGGDLGSLFLTDYKISGAARGGGVKEGDRGLRRAASRVGKIARADSERRGDRGWCVGRPRGLLAILLLLRPERWKRTRRRRRSPRRRRGGGLRHGSTTEKRWREKITNFSLPSIFDLFLNVF